MRPFLAVLPGLLLVSAAIGADKPDLAKRHGIDADLKAYSQATPKDTVASIIKAVEAKKVDYLAAHLADPAFVDQRLKDTRTTFAQFVEEDVKRKWIDDPGPLKLMQKFLAEGEFQIDKDKAVVRVKGVADRALCLREINGRWFLENRFQPEEKK